VTTLLILTIVLPLAFAAAVLARPRAVAKWWALGGTTLPLILGAMLFARFFTGV